MRIDEINCNSEDYIILIIDDNRDIHQITKTVFFGETISGKGLCFISKYDEDEAIAFLKQHHDKISVILLDIVMKERKGGVNVIETLRNDLKNNITQIIIRSAYTEEFPVRQFVSDFNIHDYLEKGETSDARLFGSVRSAIRTYSALKLSETQSQLKDIFLANMSHEIRTPMNTIIGFSDLLSRHVPGDREQVWISAIKAAGDYLLAIISDILDISKIEAGMMAFEEHVFSIKNIFRTLDIMFIGKAKEKNLELSFSCPGDIPEAIFGDDSRLSQILINLVGNAIKFTKQGSVHVSVKVIQQTGENVVLEFSVKDTGIGIPGDADGKLEYIFDRFRQAESDNTRKYGGTGLGLSIAKQLVELQGGTISVESVLNKGTVFTFTIPFRKTDKAVKETDTAQEVNREKISKLNMLLVEDNPMIIKFFEVVFAEDKIKFQVAMNGLECIEILKTRNDFDIILMDISMPVMDGYEATTIIRKELRIGIPIIALTAHAMAGEKERCLALGMNDYISKPVNINQLYEKVFRLINSDQATIQPGNKAEEDRMNNLYNLSSLIENTKGKKHSIKEIMNAWLKQMPVQIQSLSDAIEKKDFERIKVMAHTLKSSASLMGISRLIPILQEMYDLGASSSGFQRIKELYSKCTTLCFMAMEAIEKESHNYDE